MESPQQLLGRAQLRRKRFTVGGVIFAVVVVVLAIVVPCVVLLRDHVEPVQPVSVLLPLYIYPTDGAWDPLFTAIADNTNVDFTVIVNPQSGPGNIDGADRDYIAPLQQLNAASNVRTVGYVRTGYAERDIDAVVQDVDTYARWSRLNANLTLHGIFFDEAPHEYSERNREYLATANQAVKDSTLLGDPKLVIHNPGTIPDARLLQSNTDVTVVFEHSYDLFSEQQDALASLPADRSAYSIMVHSVPDGRDLAKVVRDMSRRARYLFATTADSRYYERFAGSWAEFVGVMGR